MTFAPYSRREDRQDFIPESKMTYKDDVPQGGTLKVSSHWVTVIYAMYDVHQHKAVVPQLLYES